MKNDSPEYFSDFCAAIYDYYDLSVNGTHTAPTSFFKKRKIHVVDQLVRILYKDGILKQSGRKSALNYKVEWFDKNFHPDPIFCRQLLRNIKEESNRINREKRNRKKLKKTSLDNKSLTIIDKDSEFNDKQCPIPFPALKVQPPNNLEARFDSFEDSLKTLLQILNKIYADIVNHKIQNFQQSKFDERFNLLNDKIETLLKQTAPAPMPVKMRKRNIWKSFLKFLFSIRFRMPIVLRSPFIKR